MQPIQHIEVKEEEHPQLTTTKGGEHKRGKKVTPTPPLQQPPIGSEVYLDDIALTLVLSSSCRRS